MPVIGRTREQIRTSVGYNLRAFRSIESDAAGTIATFITDELSLGGTDEHLGGWLVFTSGTNDGEIRRIVDSSITNNRQTLTFHPEASAATSNGDTAEYWKEEYNPESIHEFINQSIIEATGSVFDPVENVSLHSDGHALRFDIPSGITVIQDIYYRDNVESTRLHACGVVFDESVDDHISAELDTKDRKQGFQSCKFTFNSSTVAGEKATDSITSKDISGYDYIEFWIKSTVLTSSGNLQLHLDNHTNCQSPIETVNIPALSADTWTFVRSSLSNPELNTAIISIGLDMDVDIAPCVVWLDDISVVKNDTGRWVKVPRNLWNISRQENDIILDEYFNGVASYNLLKLVGGDNPTLLTSDSDSNEIDDQYVIAKTTGLAFMTASASNDNDASQRVRNAAFWLSEAEKARRKFPVLVNARSI